MANIDENKTLNNKIRKLAPDAIEAMGEMLRDPHTPAPTKAQLIGFILERTLGKPDTTIRLMNAGATVKESENRLIAIAEEVRAIQNSEFIIQNDDDQEQNNDEETDYPEDEDSDDDEDAEDDE